MGSISRYVLCMTTPDQAARRAVLDRIGSLEREQSVLFAKQARAHTAMADEWGGDPDVLLELAGTARIGQAKAGGQLGRDERLVRHFPIALGLLEHGVMRVGTVEILLAVSKKCSVEVMELLDVRLSERICLMDAVDVRRLVAATILEVEAEIDAEAQRERHEQARANRGVWVFDVEDGMARIGAEVDQVDAQRFKLDLAEVVRAQKVLDDRDGVVRTNAQREADVLAELPSRVLALADAASRGDLERLLAQAAADRAAETGASSSSSPVPAPRRSPESADADELPLDLPSVEAPLWWERDRDELVLDLLRLPVRKPTTLNVHTQMTTLLDLDQRSGWIEGMGPVPAMRARMLLPVAGLRRVAVDERTGVPLGIDPLTGVSPPWAGEFDPPEPRHRARPGPASPEGDRTVAQVQRERLLLMLGAPIYLNDRAEPQHDPSTALRELARVRDQACDGPGCPRRASGCDLDHELDFALGGQTAIWNLRHRSPRCHICKRHGWTVCHDEATAISTWTSPAGSVFERRSVWDAPVAVADDLELPEPRLVEPLDLVPDRVDADEDPQLLRGPEPRTTRRLRGVDPDTVDERGKPLPRPASSDPQQDWGWDDGSPPF